jgi:hypothetical protein
MERPLQALNSTLHEQLFSRGRSATPPLSSQSQLFAMNQPQPASSSSSPSNHIDSLFQGITSQQLATSNPQGNNSAPATPTMTANHDGPLANSPANSAADRQSALLSLLATSVPASTHLPPFTGPPASQQLPTTSASSSSQRSGQSPSNNSETQGKILLEQLMAG